MAWRTPPSSTPAHAAGKLFNEFKEGLAYIKDTPMILASIIAAYVISIFVGIYTRFLAVFAKDVLQVGPEGLGLLVAAPSVGAVASLIVLGALEERWNRTRRCLVVFDGDCSRSGKAKERFFAKATPFLLMLFCWSRSLGCRYYCSDCSAACKLFFAR
jgi:hypothetical protein